jgi:uncharacterized protein YecE (DUF72 family)
MIFVGTSGWQYRDWRGRFYPPKLPQREWLAHFSSRFPTVEINNTFYMLPKEESFERWARDSTPGFVITVKGSRYITHTRRLREARDSVELFWGRARKLGGKLGPILFQLPPRFPADVDRLRSFLTVLPKRMRAAFEFRDKTWESDAVYRVLDDAGAAWVIPDRPGWRVPDVVTGGWSYVRFHEGGHAPRGAGYSRDKLRRWAERIASFEAADVFVYFNNDAGAAAVRDAQVLMDLMEQRGLTVARARSGTSDAAAQ